MDEKDYQYIIDEYLKGRKLIDISKDFNVERRTLEARLKSKGIFLRNLRVNHDFFSIENEDSMYWLGFIMADGCILNSRQFSICLSAKDSSHVFRFCEDIKSILKPTFYKDKRGLSFCRKTISSSKMVCDLQKYNCLPRKSLTLELPKNINPGLLHHFIRGYFDGDGGIYLRNIGYDVPTGIVYFAGTKAFLEDIKKILDVKSKVRKYSNSSIYELRIGGNKNLRNIFNFLYKDATLWMERKRNKFLTILNKITMLRQYKCEFCDFVIDKWFKHGRKSPKEPLKCKNCLKKGLRQVYTTNWFPPAEPTTFGKQSEVNCKRLGKEKVQLMYEDEPFTKQRKAQAKNIPWFRSGKVPGTERMEKALDVSKIKDTRKYIETGEKD